MGMAEAKRLLKLEPGTLEAEREETGGRQFGRMTLSESFAMFLEDTEAKKSRDTFLDYKRWCTEFAKQYGAKQVRAVTKADANDFKHWLMKATYIQAKQPPKRSKPKTVTEE